LGAVSLDENPYADWSTHLFTTDRTQYVILSNTTSLYSIVMYGRGVTNGSVFIERALSSLHEFMEADGQEFVYRRLVAPARGTVRFAKALNRSVIGSMNELIQSAKIWLADGDLSPFDVGFKLNDFLLSALATEGSGGYGKPREAFKLMAGRCESSDAEED